VVFLCENNQWAISTHISKQMRVPSVAAHAAGYAIQAVTCDGFDPLAVYGAVRDARAHAASGKGPALVESMCYRFLSHTTDDDDRTYRTRDEVAERRPQDPVPTFERSLLERGTITEADAKAIKREITELVNRTTDEIEAEPYPERETLYGNVYERADDPWT
jgi:2-oxoisovalerate dehydrogenase E1 component alpha subunit